jgi:hypothetical protein
MRPLRGRRCGRPCAGARRARRRLVGGGEGGVGAGAEADAGGALLHGLHRVLHLEDPSMGAERRHVGVVLVPEHSRSFYCCPLRFFPNDLGICLCGMILGAIIDFVTFKSGLLHFGYLNIRLLRLSIIIITD